MKTENLKRANKLREEIEQLRDDIKVLEHALSDSFKSRDGILNTLGTRQDGYFTTIPENVSKTIYKIILLECKDMLNKCQAEFDSL